jgi:hypothetical protein
MRINSANCIWSTFFLMLSTTLRTGSKCTEAISSRFARIHKAAARLRFGSLRLTLPMCALTLCVFLFVSPGTAKAQSGSIRGIITDQTGGVVPDVAVTATNMATNVVQQVKSHQDGAYSFLQLAVGDYTVRAEKTGFKVFTATRIHLDINTVYTQDIQLTVGAVTELVEVEASGVQVETGSAQLGTVIDSNQIVNMPLLGRNFVNLQALQPGVMGGADRFGVSGQTDFATNGGESQFNVFLIDGTDTNDIVLNTTTFIPPPDALSEFRMVTSTVNPEYARSSGAILSALIKSGTNRFHGDAYDFYRDTFLNGKDPHTHNRQTYHSNDFGGTIGGPVFKDHTFFFVSYEGHRASRPQPGEESLSPVVYTSAQLAGTFGPAVAGSHLSPFPLWGDTCPPSGPKCAAGTPYSTLFASGNIPTQDFSSFSMGIVTKYVPLPSPGGVTFNWNGTRQDTDDQYIVRIDQTFTSKDSLWGTWVQERFPVVETVPFAGATLPGFGEINKEHFKFLSLAWTHLFNDHMLNELRGGYNRFNYDAVEPSTPTLPSAAGFGITPQDAAGAGFPFIDVQSMFHLGFSQFGPQPRLDTVYQAADNFSFTQGRHILKFGFDMRRWGSYNPTLNSNNGAIVFRSYGTYSTGNAGADFLLGIPTRYLQGSGGIEDARAQQYYSYVQDQFRLRPNLTLTYGLGWTIDTPMINIAYGGHGQVAFRAGAHSTIFPNAPVGVVYEGDPGVHPAGSTRLRQFGPRVGFSYSPGWGGWLTGGPGKTSIRGGFGIYYDRSETEQGNQVTGMPPFAISDSIGVQRPGQPPLQNINPSFANPFQDIATGVTVANPFPYTPPASVLFTSANGNLPVFGGCCAVLDGGTRDPMAENYNLTIERQLTSSMLLTVGYVGSVAHHLTSGLPVNLATGVDSSGNVINQYDPAVYGPIDTIFSNGNSRYNSLQVSVNRRLSHGLQFLASYTYSHSIDDTSGFENSAFGTFGGEFGGFSTIRAANPYCQSTCDKASSIFDARHRLVISYFYEIPGLQRNQLLSRLTKGWTIGGVTTFQTGFPLDVADGATPSGGCNGGGDFSCWEGPNQVGPVHYLNPRTTGNWFDPSAFAVVPCELAAAGCPGSGVSPTSVAAYGNAPRNVLRGPGINVWDLQLFKDTQITESKKIELRIEFYNLFNHTQYDPNGVVTDISASNFGAATTTLPPRRIQLAAKFIF